jgi:hypothetical protein
VRSESRCALRLRYVDLVVRIEFPVEVCAVVSLYSVVKQRLKGYTGKMFNCLIRFNSGSGLYRRSWTSLPTPFVSAQLLSERTGVFQRTCHWLDKGLYQLTSGNVDSFRVYIVLEISFKTIVTYVPKSRV